MRPVGHPQFSPAWELSLLINARNIPVSEPKVRFIEDTGTNPEPLGMPLVIPLHSERHPLTLTLCFPCQSSILHTISLPNPTSFWLEKIIKSLENLKDIHVFPLYP